MKGMMFSCNNLSTAYLVVYAHKVDETLYWMYYLKALSGTELDNEEVLVSPNPIIWLT